MTLVANLCPYDYARKVYLESWTGRWGFFSCVASHKDVQQKRQSRLFFSTALEHQGFRAFGIPAKSSRETRYALRSSTIFFRSLDPGPARRRHGPHTMRLSDPSHLRMMLASDLMFPIGNEESGRIKVQDLVLLWSPKHLTTRRWSF